MGYLCAMSTLYGIDFTSSPSSRKPVTVACGHVADDGVLILESIERLPAWSAFEAFLMRPGPWLGAFDFPFGLPRESVLEHGWPTDWAGMVRAVSLLSRNEFKALADAERAPRPVGQKYAHRATDRPAGSHSPMKFVNPPVGWMFQEGARRLLEYQFGNVAPRDVCRHRPEIMGRRLGLRGDAMKAEHRETMGSIAIIGARPFVTCASMNADEDRLELDLLPAIDEPLEARSSHIGRRGGRGRHFSLDANTIGQAGGYRRGLEMQFRIAPDGRGVDIGQV